MKKMKNALLLLAAAMFVFAGSATAQNFKYVGVKTCSMCHKKKTGNQYKIWKESKHSQAFKTLQTEEAKAVGKKLGVDDPSKSEKCLKCHVTAYNVPAAQLGKKYKKEDGVECESCHGPGSKYKSKKTMKNHEKAIAAGLTDFKDKATIEAKCKTCHNEKSPSYKEFKFDEMWAKIKHNIPKK